MPTPTPRPRSSANNAYTQTSEQRVSASSSLRRPGRAGAATVARRLIRPQSSSKAARRLVDVNWTLKWEEEKKRKKGGGGGGGGGGRGGGGAGEGAKGGIRIRKNSQVVADAVMARRGVGENGGTAPFAARRARVAPRPRRPRRPCPGRGTMRSCRGSPAASARPEAPHQRQRQQRRRAGE